MSEFLTGVCRVWTPNSITHRIAKGPDLAGRVLIFRDGPMANVAYRIVGSKSGKIRIDGKFHYSPGRRSFFIV